jgi:hypothetical protein
MKKKISRILGVVLSLALLSSLAFAAPTSAAGDPDVINEWESIDLPAVEPDSDVGPLAIDPNDTDTLYAGVLEGIWFGSLEWSVVKSEDGGVAWDYTNLTGLSFFDIGAIVDIVVSVDGTVYVATLFGDIYRLEDGGEGDVMLLKSISDNMGQALTDADYGDGWVYDIDVWNDGSYNWILVACDLDVLVLKDALFEDWRDQELSDHAWAGGNEDWPAYQVAFSPDFNSSSLIWAITMDSGGDFRVTSTVSPGQWGWLIDDDVELWNQADNEIEATPYCTLAFPSDYTSEAPLVYAALSSNFADDGNLVMIEAAYETDDSESTPLLTNDVDVRGVQVSGDVILASTLQYPTILRSDDAGADFDVIGYDPVTGNLVGKGATGWGINWTWWGYTFEDYSWTHVYMGIAPGETFDTDDGVVYVSTIGAESAVSKSTDGGVSYNQISYIDNYIDDIVDLAFSPEGGSQPAMMISAGGSYDGYGFGWGTNSLWATDDIADEEPSWERVACVYPFTLPGNSSLLFTLVEYAMYDSSIMLYGMDVMGDLVIWKSTDDGQTFSHWRDVPAPVGAINDWVVVDGRTVYVAAENGFWGRSAYGPSTMELFGELNSIAVQPGFDADDEDNCTILVGGASGGALDGEVAASADAGETWGAEEDVGDGNVFVAFDADFATAGADGEGLAYAATDTSVISVLTISGDAVAADDLEDSFEDIAEGAFNGLVVSPDNALYASGVTVTGAEAPYVGGTIDLLGDTSAATATVTIPLTEIDVISGDFDDGEDVTVFSDPMVVDESTIIITGTIYFEGDTSTAYGSIDFTVMVEPADGFTEGEDVDVTGDTLTVSWTPTGGDEQMWRLLLHEEDNVWEFAELDYISGLWLTEGSNILWTVVNDSPNELAAFEDTLSGQVKLKSPIDGDTIDTYYSATLEWISMLGAEEYEYKYDTATGTTEDTEADIEDLEDNTTYEWKVRAVEPYTSRWSSVWDFTTMEFIATPENQVPVNGMQDAPILPSFVWSKVPNAISYEFELSTDPAFGSTIVSKTTTITAYTCTIELAYDTNHYWRVRAVSATGTKSEWCFSNFHTMLEPTEPITIEPAPTPTIILPTPTVEVPPVVTVPPAPTPTITVSPPDVTVSIPPSTVTTIQTTLEIPKEVTPAYIWAIVAIGALLTIAVIVLIIRTRRVV